MEPSDLMRLTAEKLEALGIDYFVTGSMASIFYGELRFTNDVDLVIQLSPASPPRVDLKTRPASSVSNC